MATLMKQKTDNSVWLSIFPEDVATETKSGLFVKKLLAVSISNFAYLRAMFPESAFGNRCLEDISIKILRDDSACPGASQVIRWLKGCFDAIDKKYLQTLAVVVSGSEDIVSNVIETYTFRFTYKNGEVYSSINKGDGKIHEYGPTETKKETIRLLRTILVLTQSLDNLPEQCFMAMRLTYYDDVTPIDYEPPGFRPSENTEYTFECDPITIKVGDIATPYHDLKLRLKTDKKKFAISTQDNNEEQLNVDPHLTREIDIADPAACDEVPTSNILDTAAAGSSVHDIVDTVPMSEDLGDIGKDYEVRCICGQNEDRGTLVQCFHCRTWQHGLCFGFLTEESKPIKHYCYRCSVANANGAQARPCPSFAGVKDVTQAKEVSLWRRTLNACTQLTSVNPTALARRCKVDHKTAVALVNRLAQEGIFGKTGKASKAKRVVDAQVLQEKMTCYFVCNNRGVSDIPANDDDSTQIMDFTSDAPDDSRAHLKVPSKAKSKRKADIVEIDMNSSADEVLLMSRATKARKLSISERVEL